MSERRDLELQAAGHRHREPAIAVAQGVDLNEDRLLDVVAQPEPHVRFVEVNLIVEVVAEAPIAMPIAGLGPLRRAPARRNPVTTISSATNKRFIPPADMRRVERSRTPPDFFALYAMEWAAQAGQVWSSSPERIAPRKTGGRRHSGSEHSVPSLIAKMPDFDAPSFQRCPPTWWRNCCCT